MRKITDRTRLVCLALPLLLSLFHSAPAVAETDHYGVFKWEIMLLVNQERARIGAPPLAVTPVLNDVAAVRVRDVARGFVGTRPNGEKWSSALKERGIRYGKANGVYSSEKETPQSVVRSWIQLNRSIVRDAVQTQMGIEVIRGPDGKLYVYAVSIAPLKTEGGAAPKEAAKDADVSDYGREVLRLVNIERKKEGLGSLAGLAVLDTIASARAGEIMTKFSHTRPDGSSWQTLLDRHSVKWRFNGENIAAGQKTPALVMAGWMASPGHRANILNKNFTHLGVGVRADSKGRLNWVQTFLRPK